MDVLQELGIHCFGDKELATLDVNDSTAVKSFKDEWNIFRWPWKKVSKHFGLENSSRIDIKKMMRNLLWQRYKWLCRGIVYVVPETIETLWGKIEAAVGHHPEVHQPVKYDDYVSVLTCLIEEKKLFRYRDIDVYDMTEIHRINGLSGLDAVVAGIVGR